jgi:hypothetical protein
MRISIWHLSLWKNIIRVAVRVFVKGAYIPVVSPETTSVHIAIPTEVTTQKKVVLKS